MGTQAPQPASPETFTSFGALLRFLRVRARLSQRDLSIAVGYSEAHISRLEKDQRRPDRDVIIARFLPILELDFQSPWAERLLALAAAPDEAPAETSTQVKRVVAPPDRLEGILTSKLYRPRPRPRQISRPRLQERLNHAFHTPLTIIVAPAGFGKTSLLAEWLAGQQAEPRNNSQAANPAIAWLSLDAADNDRVRFMRYLAAALQGVAPGIGGEMLALLEGGAIPTIHLLRPLLNELAQLDRTYLLIVDDYHVITSPDVHDIMSMLLEALPPQFHLVVATRENPALPLARLRGRGQLNEIRAAQLRFTGEEANRFLRDTMDLRLNEQLVQALEVRTEGWAAGLQLAALALHDQEDPAAFVAGFAGSNRYIFEYLLEEVVNRLPAHLRLFLLQTALLDRLCGELCDAVLGMPSAHNDSYSRLILRELEQRNLFLIPLDAERRWYRYHHLFTDMLRAQIRTGGSPTQVSEIYARAGHWCEAQGFIDEALHYALQSGNMEWVADLLDRYADRITAENGPDATTRWIAKLPRPILAARPQLALTYASALALIDEFAEAEALLQAAELQLPALPPEAAAQSSEVIASLRTSIALMTAQPPETTIKHGLASMALRKNLDSAAARSACLMLGCAYVLDGADAQALTLWERGLQACRAAQDGLMEVNTATHIGRVLYYHGRFDEAGAVLQDVERKADQAYLRAIPAAGYAQTIQSWIWYERNELERAVAAAEHALSLFRSWSLPRIMLHAYVPLARARQAQGDPEGANALIRQAIQLIDRHRLTQNFISVPAFQVRLRLYQGDLAAAEAWQRSWEPQNTDLRDAVGITEYYTAIRVLILQQRTEEAQALLDACVQRAAAFGRRTHVIEGYVLAALLAQARADEAAALRALEQALALTEPAGYTRVFLDEGAPMAALLRRAQAAGRFPSVCARLLAAFAQ